MNGISYIITVYNKAPFIPYMIESLKSQQGNFDREFIFIDDGSTDNSLELIRTLTANLPNTHIITQQNQGPSIATNNAVAQAQYPYLKMVDADDVIAPFATQLLLDVALKTNAAYVVSNHYQRHDFTKPFVFDPPKNKPIINVYTDTLYTVLKYGAAGSSNVLYHTEAFRFVGGCDERVFVQDMSVPLRLAKNHILASIDTPLCLSPDNADGRVMNNNAQVLHDFSAIQYYFLKDNPDLDDRYKKLILKRLTGRAWKWAKRQNNASFLSPHFLNALRGRFALTRDPTALLKKSLTAFHVNHNIRHPCRVI